MCIGSYADISVHAPTRGATSNSLSFSIFSVFQSTLPREERPLPFNALTATTSKFQSTLPREERQQLLHHNYYHHQFQSTLPREERPTQPIIPMIHNNFNPRSHERSDTFAISTIRLSHISIHAPTRGATKPLNLSCRTYRFQSTLPREERRRSA